MVMDLVTIQTEIHRMNVRMTKDIHLLTETVVSIPMEMVTQTKETHFQTMLHSGKIEMETH